MSFSIPSKVILEVFALGFAASFFGWGKFGFPSDGTLFRSALWDVHTLAEESEADSKIVGTDCDLVDLQSSHGLTSEMKLPSETRDGKVQLMSLQGSVVKLM